MDPQPSVWTEIVFPAILVLLLAYVPNGFVLSLAAEDLARWKWKHKNTLVAVLAAIPFTGFIAMGLAMAAGFLFVIVYLVFSAGIYLGYAVTGRSHKISELDML